MALPSLEELEKLPVETLIRLWALVRAQRMKMGGASGCMPQNAVDDLVKCVPDELVRNIVGDNLRSGGVPAPSGMIPPEHSGPQSEPVLRTGGWVKPQALEGSVPGIRYVDQIAAGFAERDKIGRG